MKTLTIVSKKHGIHNVLLDDEDYEYVKHWKWYIRWNESSQTFYCERFLKVNGNSIGIKMHRFIMGETNPKIEIDHKDHNGLNNQRSNLRSGTRAENNRNKRPYKSGKSPYRGVCKRNESVSIKFRTQIQVNGKKVYRKDWNTELEAALDYDRNVVKYHGEFAYLNFPQSN